MVTGHIFNYAKRRGVELQIIAAGEIDNEQAQLWFYTDDNDCEPVLFYTMNDDGTLTYRSKLMDSLEDMPGTIFDKDQLKKVICYVSDQHKADNM